MSRRASFLLIAATLLWSSVGSADQTGAAVEAGPEPIAAEAVPHPGPTRSPGVSPLPDGFQPGSTYGWRTSPRTGRRTFHAGLDFLAPRGTEVRAAAEGVVERVVQHDRVGRTRFGGYGRAIVIRHPGHDVWTFYAHLDSVDVQVGAELAAGDVIGTVGNSTNHRFRSMPTHLHFEVRHVAHGGRSPFPGPYRRYNLDPAAWLRSVGVRYGQQNGDDDAA